MHQVEIVDGPRLRSVLQRVYEQCGTERPAAEALGIGQHTFHRLLKGRTRKRIRVDTWRGIRDGLRSNALGFEPDEVSKLIEQWDASVLTEVGSHAHQQYRRWLREECRRLMPRANPVFTELFGHPEYQARFREFLFKVNRSRELPKPKEMRIWLALYRALEPLGDAQVTWGVERRWQEMHEAGELDSYLRFALERERIMLKRERDIARMNKCELPHDYAESLASDEWEPTDMQDAKSEFTKYAERPGETDQG